MGFEQTIKVFIICQLEKMFFLSKKVRFFGYIVSYQGIKIEEK